MAKLVSPSFLKKSDPLQKSPLISHTHTGINTHVVVYKVVQSGKRTALKCLASVQWPNVAFRNTSVNNSVTVTMPTSLEEHDSFGFGRELPKGGNKKKTTKINFLPPPGSSRALTQVLLLLCYFELRGIWQLLWSGQKARRTWTHFRTGATATDACTLTGFLVDTIPYYGGVGRV